MIQAMTGEEFWEREARKAHAEIAALKRNMSAMADERIEERRCWCRFVISMQCVLENGTELSEGLTESLLSSCGCPSMKIVEGVLGEELEEIYIRNRND